MVRKRRSWPNSDSDSQQTLQDPASYSDEGPGKYRRSIGFWRCTAILAIVAFLVLLVVHTVTVLDRRGSGSLPCPPQEGGLLTSGDPASPGPFHDLTIAEYDRLFKYLYSQEKLNLASPERAAVNTNNIFMVDLLLPPKKDVLKFLNGSSSQPDREARVVIFRGDKSVVEEYRVGPLSKPRYCLMLTNKAKRPGWNPVPFTFRPVGRMEFAAVVEHVMSKVDKEIGFILEESYGGKFTDCGDTCLNFYPTPVGTELTSSIVRKIWFWGNYPAEYYSIHPLDFGVLLMLEGSEPAYWRVESVWYSGTLYSSMAALVQRYRDTVHPINKTRVAFRHTDRTLRSTVNLRGSPAPDPPKRPPVQVETRVNNREIVILTLQESES